jgi:O-acetyl-ADP-ribose deacetylase (regulator of RNase III)
MINFIKGDATQPQCDGIAIIAHICNNENKWGKGFVLAISKKWIDVKLDYHEWAKTESFQLGNIKLVKIDGVEPDIFVANMIAQNGIYPKNNIPPIRYEALESCLTKLAIIAKEKNASIHMPRIGCGLAGGEWNKVESIINKCLHDIPVTIYDL